jgi:uncharacterized protein
MRLVSALAAALLLVALPASAAPTFPQLTGRVVDAADIIPAATEVALSTKLAALEAQTTDQFVVVTLPSLQGYAIADFGYQLGRAWGIGQEGKDNGLLLIVAPNEREVRFEVGYGLEGTMTDALTRVIIETAILPRFRANDMAGGIQRGVEDAIQVLVGDAGELQQLAAAQQAEEAEGDDVWAVLLPFLIFVVVILVMNAMGWRRGSRMLGGALGSTLGSSRGWGGGSGRSSGGGFSGGGGSFGGGGSSGRW